MEFITGLDWYYGLIIIVGPMIVLMALGMPVAFTFMLVCFGAAFIYFGGETGLRQFAYQMRESVLDFAFLPIPLFVLMGVVIFYSGVAPNMMDALDKWIGRVPGRLGLLAVIGGTIFATLSGDSSASTAMLGSMLVPEMEKRGYRKAMTLGPVLGSGGLAIMIPPSALVIFVAALGHVSVGASLIAIIIPGLMMALLYGTYIVVRSWLQPSIAPPYEKTIPPLKEKLVAFAKYILPLGLVLFSVLGVIFMGIATPTEAAATGALSTFVLAALYRRLTWKVVKDSALATLKITCMIFMIIVAAKTYSQVLTFSGASRGLLLWATSLPISPTAFVGMITVILIIVGMFMSVPAILMLAVPIWMPVIIGMGMSDVWFLVLLCLNVEMAVTTPPYGLSLFVMKGVAPPDTKMTDCYWAGLPFLACDSIVMILLIFFPQIALWLPSMMR